MLAQLSPWSRVNDRRSCSGRVVIVRVMASRTAPAPWPASAGPFLTRAPEPWPSRQVQQHRARVVRSTRVPMAELWTPRRRSSSQCPGTARSFASVGRSLIITSGLMKALPRPRARARGTRSARPVRRNASTRAEARRGLAHIAPGRSPRGCICIVSLPGSRAANAAQLLLGLHAIPHRRFCRGPCRRPFHGTIGPRTAAPSWATTWPASRSCAYARSAALIASFARFGRRADRSACHCAVLARYSSPPLRVAALRLNSRRDGRCSSTKSTGDLSHSQVLCKRERDLLPLGKC